MPYQGRHPVGMAQQGRSHLAGGNVPQMDDLLLVGGRQALAVRSFTRGGAKGQGTDRLVMAPQLASMPPACCVPETNAAVVVAGGQQTPVRRESQRRHPCRRREDGGQIALAYIPQRQLVGAGSRPAAARCKGPQGRQVIKAAPAEGAAASGVPVSQDAGILNRPERAVVGKPQAPAIRRRCGTARRPKTCTSAAGRSARGAKPSTANREDALMTLISLLPGGGGSGCFPSANRQEILPHFSRQGGPGCWTR